MELTELETKIIEAYRNGAKVELTWYCEKNNQIAIDRVRPFGDPRWDASEGTKWVTANAFPRVEATVFVE